MKAKELAGEDAYPFVHLLPKLLIGWPLYLLCGFSGGPKRGFGSHFIIPNELFKGKEMKVHLSNLGLLFVCYLVYKYA